MSAPLAPGASRVLDPAVCGLGDEFESTVWLARWTEPFCSHEHSQMDLTAIPRTDASPTVSRPMVANRRLRDTQSRPDGSGSSSGSSVLDEGSMLPHRKLVPPRPNHHCPTKTWCTYTPSNPHQVVPFLLVFLVPLPLQPHMPTYTGGCCALP